MIVFSAFVPHTPLMIPTVGKEARDRISGTISAIRTLSGELYASMVDTLVVISSHADEHSTAFSGNLHDAYEAKMDAFGDFERAREFLPNLAVFDALQRALRRDGIPFTLNSESVLDYGTAVPLLALTEMLPRVRIVPLCDSGLGAKEHVSFGGALADTLANRQERVGILATGDLSHCLSEQAPGGYCPEGPAFDAAVRSAIERMDASQLLALDEECVLRARECAYRPLLILLGATEDIRVRPEILSYESPFGVGYLAAQFHLD